MPEYAPSALLRRRRDDGRIESWIRSCSGSRMKFNRLSERVYGVEDRSDVITSRLDIMRDELRGDVMIAVERIDGLRQLLERSRNEEREQRAVDQRLLYALVKDHSRRLRAIERLERRRHAQQQ